MTIPTSYSTLRTAIAERRERVGDATFEAMTADFVALCENKLNRLAPARMSEVDTTLTATASSRNITLPSDFVEAKALFLTTYGPEVVLPPFVPGVTVLGTTNAPPSAWSLNAGNLELNNPADSAHTFRFRYRKKLFALATTDPNWLLTNYPDVYLYGALVEAARYEVDQVAQGAYEADFRTALNEVRWLEARTKAIARLRVDPALMPYPPTFDINAG